MLFSTKEYYCFFVFCFCYYFCPFISHIIGHRWCYITLTINMNFKFYMDFAFFGASQMYSLQTDVWKKVNHFGWTIAYSNPKSLFFRIIPDRKTPNAELMFLWSRSLNNGGHVVCGAHQGLFGVVRSPRSWSTSHLTHSLGCVTTLMGPLSAPFVSLPSVCHSLPCYWI